MQFYSITKYQNINDRIKRLANQSTQNTSSTNTQSFVPQANKYSHKINSNAKNYLNQYYRADQSKNEQTYVYQTQQQSICGKAQERYHLQNYSKNLSSHKSKMINKSVEILNFNEYSQGIKGPQRNYLQKQIQVQQKSLNKLKNDQAIKIQDILQSYNSYKQNKEKFMQTINKDMKKSEDAKPKQSDKIQENLPQDEEKIEKIFQPIENIWGNYNYDNTNKIEKYKQRILQSKQKSQKFSKYLKTSEDQHEHQQHQMTFTEKPKLIFKNIRENIIQNSPIAQKLVLGGLHSPRAPGKIVKNVDRTIPIKIGK